MPSPLSLRSAATLLTFLGAALVATGCSSASTGDESTGSTNGDDATSATEALSSANKQAFDFFVSKGLSDAQAAAIVGNLDQESGMSPTIQQYGGGPGRGIAQWSAGGRWDRSANDNLMEYARQHGENAYALSTQLNFIWYELETFRGYGLSELRASSALSSATVVFQDKYEICGACNQTARIRDAEAALQAFGHGALQGGSQKGCYSQTLGRQEPDNACVQSKFDRDWYQCASGSWTNRWDDPQPCNGVHAL